MLLDFFSAFILSCTINLFRKQVFFFVKKTKRIYARKVGKKIPKRNVHFRQGRVCDFAMSLVSFLI